MRFITKLLFAILIPVLAHAECAWIDFDANSNIIRVKINSITDGQGLTGLSSSTTNLKISMAADNEATATVYAVASSNVETIATLATYSAPTSGKIRFKEFDATNMSGIYEIQAADSRFSVANAKSVLLSIRGDSPLRDVDCQIRLLDSASTLWSSFAAASESDPVTTTGGGGSSSGYRKW